MIPVFLIWCVAILVALSVLSVVLLAANHVAHRKTFPSPPMRADAWDVAA
jgi:hypothetical protein